MKFDFNQSDQHTVVGGTGGRSTDEVRTKIPSRAARTLAQRISSDPPRVAEYSYREMESFGKASKVSYRSCLMKFDS